MRVSMYVLYSWLRWTISIDVSGIFLFYFFTAQCVYSISFNTQLQHETVSNFNTMILKRSRELNSRSRTCLNNKIHDFQLNGMFATWKQGTEVNKSVFDVTFAFSANKNHEFSIWNVPECEGSDSPVIYEGKNTIMICQVDLNANSFVAYWHNSSETDGGQFSGCLCRRRNDHIDDKEVIRFYYINQQSVYFVSLEINHENVKSILPN